MTADQFTRTVAGFAERHDLLSRHAPAMVALSGGADSVALLTVLRSMGHEVVAAHCNFHLRGDESDRDEQFVRSLCQRLGVELHVEHFDTRAYAEQHKVSIEMAARDLRYDYFHRLRAELGAAEICVAHHRDDSVETVLINLMRGTGIGGLTGIKPRNEHVVRPLLCVGRDDILAYLQDIGQDYVTDSSNLVADVVRNRVRLQLLPLMRQINPSVAECIQRTAQHLGEAQKVYNQAIDQAITQLLRREGPFSTVSIGELRRQPSPESTLYALLTQFGFTPAQADDIAQRLDAKTGAVFVSPAFKMTIHGGNMIFADRLDAQPPFAIDGPGTYSLNDDSQMVVAEEPVDSGFNPRRGQHVACLDADKLLMPLTVRRIEAGDRFVPYGMKGSQLVSDYLTNRKRHVLQRERQLAVIDASGRMAWLVGERTDNRFAIDPKTHKALVLTLQELPQTSGGKSQ